MLDPKVFLKLLQLDLQAHPPGAPVVKVSIAAQPAEPRRTQNGLFQPSAPEAERLEVTLARIQSMVDGQRSTDEEQRVGSAEMLDTHRPDAFRINRFATVGPAALSRAEAKMSRVPHPDRCWKGGNVPVIALRLMRPPISAKVVVRTGKPVRVECEPVQGEIAWAAGPWKASGGWWSEKPWVREEWDVCVGAACYRIYRDAKGWFVEGTYD